MKKWSLTNLEIEIHAFLEVAFVRIALMLPHEEAESIVPVSGLSFRQEYRIVEAQVLTARQPLLLNIIFRLF